MIERRRPRPGSVFNLLVVVLVVCSQHAQAAGPKASVVASESRNVSGVPSDGDANTSEGSHGDDKSGPAGAARRAPASEVRPASERAGGTERKSATSESLVTPGIPTRVLFEKQPAQRPASPEGATGRETQNPAAGQSTPAAPRQLSFQEAVKLAIENNLDTQQARERRKEAHGQQVQSASDLMPNISGSAFQSSVTNNLASFGFVPGVFPGITSTFIGPFRIFDARVRLVQTVFNLSSIRNFQAGRSGVEIAKLREELAEQQVTTQTALAYLNDLRAHWAVDAAKADLDLAINLEKQAKDQHDAGVATGVDVTRAETRVAEERVAVAQAERDANQARLELLRTTGLSFGATVSLTDAMQFTPQSQIDIPAAVSDAEQNRVEVKIAAEQAKMADYERKAAQAEQLPSIQFAGDYGDSGITPSLIDLPTRSVAIRLNVPIFNGGLTRGRIESTTSRLRQAELFLKDVRTQVEEDVRLAEQDLTTATDQVNSANQSFNLAQRELQMARDRFSAGVGDNIEVLNAQTALANARQAQVSALAIYNAARINLSAALGRVKSFRL